MEERRAKPIGILGEYLKESEMQYYEDLPEISSSGSDENSYLEFEINGKIERLPDDTEKMIVLVGQMGGTIYLVFGHVVDYKYTPSEISLTSKDFTRLVIDGTCVTVY